MFKLITFVFVTLPILLAWLCFAAALVCIVITAMRYKRKSASGGLVALFIISVIYSLVFAVGYIFFRDSFESIVSIVGILIMVISVTLSRYKDRCAGRRWWY